MVGVLMLLNVHNESLYLFLMHKLVFQRNSGTFFHGIFFHDAFFMVQFLIVHFFMVHSFIVRVGSHITGTREVFLQKGAIS